MDLIDKYKIRLKQLLDGLPEIYKGELDNIKAILGSRS